MNGFFRWDSNYLPVLDAAERLLEAGYHESCARSVFLLSDGALSDAGNLRIVPAATEQRIRK
jgi:hypothetical protein